MIGTEEAWALEEQVAAAISLLRANAAARAHKELVPLREVTGDPSATLAAAMILDDRLPDALAPCVAAFAPSRHALRRPSVPALERCTGT